MPDWLFKYFGEVISPMINTKKNRKLTRPPIFENHRSYLPASMWIYPPEPIMSLSHHAFNPEILWRPRVFLWLPHFFVESLRCPNCRSGVLEKNGACPPRRIVDIDSLFWIVTWAYYCRTGCQSHFRGWHPSILNSLPAYLRLAFPAVLTRKSGISHRVITQLRVGNQHKMGPSGTRSLLLELHTRRFNVLQAQYLEAVYELVCGYQDHPEEKSQTSLHAYMDVNIPPFGDFGDPERYAGHVPSEFYLAGIMNNQIEQDEVDANQHTTCISPDQISIDDSYKVG